MGRWRRWRPGPRAGRPGCSWPRYPCAGTRMPPRSWPRSPAATGMSWTIWPGRCSSGRTRSCARSRWRPRCWRGCPARCVTPSPAARAARRCSSRRSGRACSWSRWMRCAAGGATTTCSPTCSTPGSRLNNPAACRCCTATRPPGARSMRWPMRPSATRPPPARRPGRPGSSSSTSTWSTTSAARPRPSTGGSRSSPLRWSGPAPGCCWRSQSWPPPAATSRWWNRSLTRLSARPRAGPMSPSSQSAARRPASWSMSRP